MKSVLFKAVGITAGSAVLVLSFQNCGMQGFEISEVEKINILSKTSVMTFASRSGNASIANGVVGYVPVDGQGNPINGGVPVMGGGSGTGSGGVGVIGGGSGAGSGGVGVIGGGSGTGSGNVGVIGGGGTAPGSGAVIIGGGTGVAPGSGGVIIGGGTGTAPGSGTVVVGGGTGGPNSGTVTVIAGGGANGGLTGQFFVESGKVEDGKVNIPVQYYCSTNNQASLTRVVADSSTSLIIKDSMTGQEVCRENQRDNILNVKKMILSDACTNKLVNERRYEVSVAPSNSGSAYSVSVNQLYYVSRTRSFAKSMSMRSMASVPEIKVHYADNPAVKKVDANGNDVRNLGEEECDVKASPLIIALGHNIRKIDLSAPTQGLRFDIAGKNALPQAHAKKQISWFKNAMQDYYFISLPNKQGVVESVNELFGDNTYGPDHKFASDGYAALAKYDDDRDGYITPKDKVWSQLKLWQDKNLDGRGAGAELTSLDRHGIISIDLKFDPNYSEYDMYGNETKMKSVVKLADGTLNVVFDLWFRPLAD